MRVLEVIQRSTEYLRKKGVDSPRLQAELLLAHRLGMPRMRLYLEFERELSEEELGATRELVVRRGRREPLQQIVGSVSFCGLELLVDQHVLVPRPETEQLAELAWEFLHASVNDQMASPTVLDVGTGSGCLAVAISWKAKDALVTAVDVSPDALRIARENAKKHGVADRIEFCQSSLFSAIPQQQQFTLIVSNPPYIPSGEIEKLEPEIRDFEPREALDGGEDGLKWYHPLAAESKSRLRPEGCVMVEFGDGQASALTKIFEAQNWVVEKIVEDYTHRPRILIAKLKLDEQPNRLD